MAFVKDICRDVFQLKDSDIYAGLNPSYSVALGLAAYGRWKYKLEKFHTDIQALCEDSLRNKIKENILPFSDIMLKTILPLGYEKFAKPRIREFINGEREMNELGDSLLNYAGKEIADWLNNDEDGQRYKHEMTKDFLSKVLPWIDKSANEICKRYHMPEGSLNINFSIPANLFESSTADFFSKVGTSLAKMAVGNMSVSTRKKMFSWLLEGSIDSIITTLYSLTAGGTLMANNFLEKVIEFVMGKESSTEVIVKTNPFLNTIIDTLHDELSNAIHQKAKEIEIFIDSGR